MPFGPFSVIWHKPPKMVVNHVFKVIITYHKRIKQKGHGRSCQHASSANDGVPYDRSYPYGRSYGVSSPPPDQLFPPREIKSWIRRPETIKTHPEGRTLASGVHPEEGLARRRGPSSSPSTRGLQHHHHCHHHQHPSHCNIRNPSGSFCVLLVRSIQVYCYNPHDFCCLHV